MANWVKRPGAQQLHLVPMLDMTRAEAWVMFRGGLIGGTCVAVLAYFLFA